MNIKLILLIALIPCIHASESQIGTREMAQGSQRAIKKMIADFKTAKSGKIGLLENLSAEYYLYKAYYAALSNNANNLEGLTDPDILCENYAQLQSFYTPEQIHFK